MSGWKYEMNLWSYVSIANGRMLSMHNCINVSLEGIWNYSFGVWQGRKISLAKFQIDGLYRHFTSHFFAGSILPLVNLLICTDFFAIFSQVLITLVHIWTEACVVLCRCKDIGANYSYCVQLFPIFFDVLQIVFWCVPRLVKNFFIYIMQQILDINFHFWATFEMSNPNSMIGNMSW
jgi:hypothetical protein